MAVRDFLDENNVKWKVWPVSHASIHPRTAAEDYLGDYAEGWLCFESPNERRRLAHFPDAWDKIPDKELCALLDKAAPVPARGKVTPPKPGESVNP